MGGTSQSLSIATGGASRGIYASPALTMLALSVCHNLDALSNVLKHYLHILLMFSTNDWAVANAERRFISSVTSAVQRGKTCDDAGVLISLVPF